jgi:hypothetical protein
MSIEPFRVWMEVRVYELLAADIGPVNLETTIRYPKDELRRRAARPTLLGIPGG